jgi:hypothetical protein
MPRHLQNLLDEFPTQLALPRAMVSGRYHSVTHRSLILRHPSIDSPPASKTTYTSLTHRRCTRYVALWSGTL